MVRWPEKQAARYRAAGYWRDRPLGELLAEGARARGEGAALVWDGGSLTYPELEERAARLAAGLAGLGLRPGDRVVVQLPNEPGFFVLLFALLRIGAVPVLGLPAYRRSEIVHLCRQTGAVAYAVPATDPVTGFDHRELADTVRAEVPELRHVLVDGDPGRHRAHGLDAVERAGSAPLPASLPEPDPGAPALLLVSGGTTGLPKLIPRTHNDYAYNARASAELCGLGPGTVYLAALPVAHNFALACPGVLGTLGAGGTVVLSRSPGPETVFPLIAAHRVTITSAVPPLAALWLQAAEWDTPDLGSLQLLQVGGARLSPEVARRVPSGLGCTLQQVFGMAEGLLSMTRLSDDEELTAVSQGRPLSPDDEIRVVDEEDRDVAPGEVGELLTRGPYTPRGYYRAAEHNARAFTPDGFYRTGDLVRVLPGGELVVEGRQKDLVNRGGDKVSADELEGHLRAHPAVLDAAVVPVPDPYLGERTCAFLVLRAPHTAEPDLAAFLDERGVAAFKCPDLVHLLDALPVTGVGKVDKRALARRAADSGERSARSAS
ncbi:(2,3-dihydroxybenzoyl)adenylate synthase [Streptomyces sp. NPDC048172]|uniref:(2,3-dihydroxybenzoyl)adenylate synthase n=1 Tax=Streptomyces sp. NPDC048172 TaxID=3365505 RepID=UPI0037105B90